MADVSRRTKHALEAFFFRALALLLRAVPRRVARTVGTGLARFTFDVLGIRRRVAITNVLERLQPAGGEREAAHIARESYAVHARTFVDLLRLDRFTDERLWSILPREHVQWFIDLLKEGQGCLLVSAHFGNWEIFALGLARCGIPMHVLANDQANARVNEYVNAVRRSAGIETLSSRKGLRDAVRVLRENGFLATLMDQDAHEKGVFAEFLGTPTATHTGPLALAARTRTPLVAAVFAEHEGRYTFLRTEPWRPRSGATEEESLREGAEQFNRFLEKAVRRFPDNYFWAHRRWKTRPPGDET